MADAPFLLFRTFLTHKLAQTCSSAEIAALHRRAAAWYRQEGNAAEAIRHALAAQDIALAADVVEANLYAILNEEAADTDVPEQTDQPAA